MDERIRCCVPFCRRTHKPMKCEPVAGQVWEWICQAHWRQVRRDRRRAYARVRKIWHGGDGRGMTLGEIMAHPKWGNRAVHRAAKDRLWERIKREAIERAAGI
ncbi:MAG: hypothetical protein KGZ68_11010 [Dechloromonas sp.]|nr:hypothetical protein [Dechloromonas sp.]